MLFENLRLVKSFEHQPLGGNGIFPNGAFIFPFDFNFLRKRNDNFQAEKRREKISFGLEF